MIFTVRASKGNDRGVGFIRIPIGLRNNFKVNDNIKITIFLNNGNVNFYGRIKDYSGLGVYVPTRINTKHNLLHREFEVAFEKTDGFYTKLGNDGRFYIPKNIFKELNLGHDDLILVEANVGDRGGRIEKICKVKTRERGSKTESFCMFDPRLGRKSGVFKIKKRLEKKPRGILHLLNDLNYGIVDRNSAIVFHGKKMPIMINTDIKLPEMAYYLGAFFADGTKRGNSWGLCASTFKQASYYFKMHNKLVQGAKLDMYVSFTGFRKNGKAKSLPALWNKKTGIDVTKAIFHKSYAKDSDNRNKYGTLVFREHRKLTQTYYNKLIRYLCEEIKNNGDLALDFICGVLEGDGSPSSRGRGHIIIATNKNEMKLLENVLPYTNLEYKSCRENATGKVYVRLNSLGLLKNLPTLKNKLFKYYPKRRERFIKRFLGVGAVRFIIGKQKYASGWVKTYLKNSNILDDSYTLTPYGKKVRRCIKDMIKEIV